MNYKLFIVCIIACLYHPFSSPAQKHSLTQALYELDEVLAQRETFIEQKKGQLKELKKQAKEEKNLIERYHKYKYISEIYLSSNADLALTYAQKAYRITEKLGTPDLLIEAQLQLVQTYRLQTMYIEAFEVLEKVRTQPLTDTQMALYQMISASIYANMATHRSAITYKDLYTAQSHAHQDSLLLFLPPNDNVYKVADAESKLRKGQKKEAIEVLKKALVALSIEDRAYAFTAYTLSSCFDEQEEKEQKMYYLALSAKSDIVGAIKENVSLRELALLLYKSGQIEKAHTYIRIALDDALASKTSFRTHEVIEILPVIDAAYQEMREQSRQHLLSFSWIASILSLLLLLAFFHIRKQKGKLENANAEILDKHQQMQNLHEQLVISHKTVAATNEQLMASNHLQEEYIARYLKLCSSYIGKIDNYRLSLSRKATKGTKEDLIKLLKSKEIVEKELQVFYADFDQSFLDLHPNFVASYNQLLKEDEQMILKPNERLNTELRIFALIRLGINESAQIADFLRYSVTTIYNYRTKARNKAKVNRDEFEDYVMRID